MRCRRKLEKTKRALYSSLCLLGGLLVSVTALAQVANTSANRESSSACTAANNSFKCQQRRQVEAIWVDLNQSIGSTIERFTADTGTVFESGCLDDIASIDFSIIRIDPASIWTDIYSSLKDELINRTCTVLEDKINEHRQALNQTLTAPFGLGSIRIANGTDIESTRDIFRFNQTKSNDQVRQEVVESVFGGRATAPIRDFSENRLALPNRQTIAAPTRLKRSEDQERVTKFVDLNKLWGKKADQQEEQEEQP